MNRNLIFVVDDDVVVCKLLERTLSKRWGYKTRIFHSGQECIEHLGDQPDLIILDIMMSGLSGVEVLRHIREVAPDLPVIMLSSQNEIEVAIETMREGTVDYFTKPVDIQRLEFSISNAMRYGALAGKDVRFNNKMPFSIRQLRRASLRFRRHYVVQLANFTCLVPRLHRSILLGHCGFVLTVAR